MPNFGAADFSRKLCPLVHGMLAQDVVLGPLERAYASLNANSHIAPCVRIADLNQDLQMLQDFGRQPGQFGAESRWRALVRFQSLPPAQISLSSVSLEALLHPLETESGRILLHKIP